MGTRLLQHLWSWRTGRVQIRTMKLVCGRFILSAAQNPDGTHNDLTNKQEEHSDIFKHYCKPRQNMRSESVWFPLLLSHVGRKKRRGGLQTLGNNKRDIEGAMKGVECAVKDLIGHVEHSTGVQISSLRIQN